MQARQLEGEYFGAPNHDDELNSELYERYQDLIQQQSSAPASQVSESERQTINQVINRLQQSLVQAKFMRVGQIAGEVPVGFLEADICFCDSNGQIINSMTRSLAIPITNDLRPSVDRMKAGLSTSDDDNLIARAILDSPQSYALGV